jgi:hypothetical protein
MTTSPVAAQEDVAIRRNMLVMVRIVFMIVLSLYGLFASDILFAASKTPQEFDTVRSNSSRFTASGVEGKINRLI